MKTNCQVSVCNKQLKRTLCHQGKPVLTYTIQYPQFMSTPCNCNVQNINQFYKENACAIKYECEHNLSLSASQIPVTAPYEVIFTYTITYNYHGIVSLYHDMYQYMGGAHGNTIRTSHTWNLCSGKKYQLSDFYPCVTDYQSHMQHTIIQQIMNDTSNYFEDATSLAIKYFNEQSFYITPQNIIIYYQQYDIAPYVYGIAEFSFPLGI